jgi:TatD DNase family protein
LNPSVDLQNAAAVVKQAASEPALFAAVGVHPNSSTTWTDETQSALRILATEKKVVAIGEIGLDYHHKDAPAEVQKKALLAQLELAQELELPVIVHNRESSEDVLAMLLDWQAGLVRAASDLADRPGVLHSFSGDREMAEKAIAAGYFIGFTGPLTFKNAPDLQALAKDLPVDKILIETDSPFLSPHPHRGQRNEPARVALVAEKLAELRGMTQAEVAETTTANAQRLFRFEVMQ